MDDKTVHAVLKQMRDAAMEDVATLRVRIDNAEREELEGFDRVALISQLQHDLEGRSHEAEALAIAVTKF